MTAVVTVLAVLLLAVAPYRPPVDAPLSGRFRAPACAWCPGNRGLDYAAAPGATVRAAGPGVVAFAGAVALVRYVTIDHPDGLRSSYGPLLVVSVAVGQRVAAGDAVGTAAGTLQFGVRRGDVYVDPLPLLEGPTRARLVPARWGPRPRAR